MKHDQLDALSLRLARMLDHASLTEHQTQQLAAARRRALQLSGREGLLRRARRLLGEAVRPALRVALSAALVLGVALTSEHLARQSGRDQAHRLDTALLVDDLPIDAYLDDGFRAWIAAGSSS